MGPKNPILIIEAPILSPHRSLLEPWKEPDLIGTSSAGRVCPVGQPAQRPATAKTKWPGPTWPLSWGTTGQPLGLYWDHIRFIVLQKGSFFQHSSLEPNTRAFGFASSAWAGSNIPSNTPKHMGGCQKNSPLLGYPIHQVLYYIKDLRRGHNFDSHPYLSDRTHLIHLTYLWTWK